MDYEANTHNVLERLLHDESAEPRELPLSLLRAITNDFDAARRFYFDPARRFYESYNRLFEVYEGVLPNGKVAVKKLCLYSWLRNDERFENEVRCLMRMRAKQHKNIVRFLGYHRADSDTQGKADERHLLLCFEYPIGGNLHPYITKASHGPSWRKRYKAIKGICEGLYYLHQNRTLHLNLSGDKIWFDKNNEPKIHDFGGSRLLDEIQNKVIAKQWFMSRENVPPEFLRNEVITLKTDIYSLGVLITEIITGRREYSIIVENILESWRDRFGTSLEDTRLEQIRVCAEIAKTCLEHDPEKRPDAEHIIELLVETESTDESTKSDAQTMELNVLERVAAGSEEPSHLDLSLLQSITEKFSEQRKIGIGGCGEVYKGILRNGIVAVKRLFNNRTIKNDMFHREVQSLITVKHKNIVRFLGYCSITEERVSKFEGRTVMADTRERLLCFEYVSNGNLGNHLTDELRGLEWHTRYEIIVGICKGLLYLHKEKGIIHMDLKPANILLDDLMVPKITDFGLSRLDNNPKAVTTSRLMTPGYCAPEYFLLGKSSSKSDIYSLGVLVKELVTGSKKEPDLTKVLRRWRHRWLKASKHTPLGYKQVAKCLQLAQRCIENDPRKRPDIVDIIQELEAMDSEDDQFQVFPTLEDMLGIEPLEIHFPSESDQQISHSIKLTNDTDGYIAFMAKARLRHFIEPNKGIVPPRSKCNVTMKMQAQVNELPNYHFKKKISVLSTKVDGALADMDGAGDMFIGKDRNVVDKVNVMVVFHTPPSTEES